MIRVLFVCTDNAARSPMAEACLRAISCGGFEASSAGIDAGELHPLTRVVLTEVGISARELRHRPLSACASERWDYVISVCPEPAHHRALPQAAGEARWLHWNIADPTMAPDFPARLKAFRESRDIIRGLVEQFVLSVPLWQGTGCSPYSSHADEANLTCSISAGGATPAPGWEQDR
jgi:protein-tyrosine-phosphatase